MDGAPEVDSSANGVVFAVDTSGLLESIYRTLMKDSKCHVLCYNVCC